MSNKTPVINNSWRKLRRYTDARIGLGRTGISQTTDAHLQFQLDHANARDAVHISLNAELITTSLFTVGLSSILLNSQAENRTVYLQRPDFGRKLNEESVERIKTIKHQQTNNAEAVIVIADGLSSTAVQRHAVKLADTINKALLEQKVTVSPICIVGQGRVAIGDEIGELFNAKIMIMIIGERPGLSAPDSLGIYYTYNPIKGLTDANRNCISNIRPAGISIDGATAKLIWLINESLKKGVSGVNLKDQSDVLKSEINTNKTNFLLQL
jgi:ethanolamine ammonia-lyase small subunit